LTRRAMVEPIIGLVVVIGLAIYLVVTLLKPERF
jgi:K+-transporting ATPase KdpF subunit